MCSGPAKRATLVLEQAMGGVRRKLSQCVVGVLQVVQDPEEKDEPIPVTRQRELPVEIDVVNLSAGAQMVAKRPGAAQPVHIRIRGIQDVDLPPGQILQRKGQVAIGGADVGYG